MEKPSKLGRQPLLLSSLEQHRPLWRTQNRRSPFQRDARKNPRIGSQRTSGACKRAAVQDKAPNNSSFHAQIATVLLTVVIQFGQFARSLLRLENGAVCYQTLPPRPMTSVYKKWRGRWVLARDSPTMARTFLIWQHHASTLCTEL